MQTLGERLEEARKRKGLSIREAAEATKIRGDYLQKFEANSFDFDLPPLYIRGFLRTYAKYLEFDPARVVSEFDTMMADQGRAPRRETRENYGRVEIGGDNGENAPRPNSGGGGGLDPVTLKYALFGGGAIVVVVVIVLLINLLSGRAEPRSSTAKQSTTETSPTAPATAELPANEATLTVTVMDTARVKIVYADNSLVFLDGKYPMNRGEQRSFNYSKDLLIMSDFPDRIRLEINGRAAAIPDSVGPTTYFRVPVIPRR